MFALGLLVLFSKLHIGFGVWAIVFGHVVFNSAYATIIIQARLASLSSTLEEAAADLGANRWRVFRRVTLAAADSRRGSSPRCCASASRSTT